MIYPYVRIAIKFVVCGIDLTVAANSYDKSNLQLNCYVQNQDNAG